MKRAMAIAMFAGLCTMLTSMVGCELMGKNHQRSASEMLAAEDKGPSEGAKSSSDDERPRGAWSSEAADIEKKLTRRSADPNW